MSAAPTANPASSALPKTGSAPASCRWSERHQTMLQDLGLGRNGFRLLDLLFGIPVVNARWVEGELESPSATANNPLPLFAEAGLVDEIPGGNRNRRFRYAPFVELFATPVEVSSSREEEASATSSV